MIDIDKWFDFIDSRTEDDIELLFEKYVIEYCKVNVCEVSESDKMDMSITFYELMSKLYCINK